VPGTVAISGDSSDSEEAATMAGVAAAGLAGNPGWRRDCLRG
jgi:hypothetical protein